MKRRTSYIAVFFTLAVFISSFYAYAQELSTQHIAESEVTKKILDNGLTVLIKEAHALPIVSIEARLKTGSANEGKFLGSGISHFIEHMLFKETTTKKHGDIEREIKSYGGDVNGFTSLDYAGYRLTVESRYFKEALALLMDAIMNPAFEENELEKERNVILKEINLQKDDPDKKAFQLLWSCVYTMHPYRYPVIGYENLFKKLTRQDLISYHRQCYMPNNMVLGVCGDIDKIAVLKEVERAFESYERQMCEVSILPSEPHQIAKREYKERTPVNIPRLLIGHHSVPVGHKDLFALDVLASILGDGQSSILHRRLVEKEKIAHSVGVYNYTPKDVGIFFISMLLDEQNILKASSAIDEEISKVKSGNIDTVQLTKAKNSTLTDFILNRETIQTQTQDMIDGEIFVGTPDFSSYYIKGIENVTLEDVVRIANLYLADNGRTVVSLLPQITKEESIQTPQQKEEITISKLTLPTGMKVIAREDHTLPIVIIRAIFQGGVRVENAENNGISNITSEMLLSGTKKNSKDEIYSSIEVLGGGITSFSGNNSFGIELIMLSKNLELGLLLLSDILRNSVFPENELNKTKDLVLAAILNREDDIFESGIKLFKQNLYIDHPYQFTILGEKNSIEKIKRRDALKFYKKFCVPSNSILAIFGDIDKQKTLTKVEKLFKGFKGKMPKELLEGTPKTKVIAVSDKKVMDKEQVLIIGGFKTIKITDPDMYIFSVLSSILSGSDGRFFYDIRDKLGISYTQGALSTPGVDNGYFLFYIATSKDHFELAKQLIIDEVEKLRKHSVTEEEIRLAKSALIGAHLRRLQSNRNLAMEVSMDELFGLGYDNFKKFSSKISSITKEDIDRVIKKYFDPENLVIVTLEPLGDTH